jgi:hypothetical protein
MRYFFLFVVSPQHTHKSDGENVPLIVEGGFVPESLFVSGKLSNKMVRQLQDPLSLCSGALPDWCEELSTRTPYLLSFNARRLYFIAKSFGIARALQVWVLE